MAKTLPRNWQSVRLDKMFDRLQKRNIEGNTNVLTISAQHGLIKQQEFFTKNVASKDLSNYYLLFKGDFAYNKSYSGGYNFGAFKRLTGDESGVVSPLYICFSPTKENECPEFYDQYFESCLLDREIKVFAQEGARNHGLLNIAIDDFFSMPIPFPPLTEQRAITEILMTADCAITLHEQLIAAKQVQERWFMQNLLTGKMRLPGFSGEWERMRLGEVCDISTGTKNTEDKVDNGEYPFYVRSQKPERINTFSFDGEAILTAGDGVGVGKVIHYVNGKFDCHQRVYRISNFHINTLGKYLYYYLAAFFYKRAKTLSAKNSVDSVRYSIIAKMQIHLPPLPEQAAIAEILATADREIDLLNRQLEQQRQVKKYLMQQLLTGRIRVRGAVK